MHTMHPADVSVGELVRTLPLRGRVPRVGAWTLAWLSVLPFTLLRAGTLAESDTFWQIRTGLLTIHERSIPATDPFSWTMHGAEWTLNSWGFNVALAVVYQLAGLPGVALAAAAVVALLSWLVLRRARSLGASPVVAGAILVAAFPLLTVYLSARPQLVDYVAALVLVRLLGVVVDGNRPPTRALGWIALLTVAWVNLHAGALLAVGIAGATTALALAFDRSRRRAGWSLAALGVVAACSMLNPYGIGVLTHASQVAHASSSNISEWQPLDPAAPLQMLMFLPGVLALVIAARRRDVVHAAALSVTAVGSLQAMRILPILLLIAIPVLASAATRPATLRYVTSRRRMLTQVACIGLGVVTVLAGLASTHLGRPDPAAYSSDVVQAIPAGCRLYNSYTAGGYVILERPDVRVSIDSRNDLYGARRVTESVAETSARRGDLDSLTGAGCVLVPPGSGLAERLGRSQAWEKLAEDSAAVLFARH
jgi:hypothetical protein